MNNDLLKVVSEIQKLSNVSYEMAICDVNYIINNKIKDEAFISKVYDEILSLMLIDDTKRIELFNQLLDYCRIFNKELTEDYFKIFTYVENEFLNEDEIILKRQVDNK